MWWSRTVAATLALLVPPGLGGCGFEPLYGGQKGAEVSGDLAMVKIGYVDDREGQILRNELMSIMQPRGAPVAQPYHLDVTLKSSKSELAVSKSMFTTRANYNMSVSYRLVETASSLVIHTASASAVGSYNVLESEYATRVAEKDVRERLARELAAQIANRVSVYFSRMRTEAGPTVR